MSLLRDDCSAIVYIKIFQSYFESIGPTYVHAHRFFGGAMKSIPFFKDFPG
jgi:hypothetical protein